MYIYIYINVYIFKESSFFRASEVLFQPSMIGLDQCGLVDVIEGVLSGYTPDVQNRLMNVCHLHSYYFFILIFISFYHSVYLYVEVAHNYKGWRKDLA